MNFIVDKDINRYGILFTVQCAGRPGPGITPWSNLLYSTIILKKPTHSYTPKVDVRNKRRIRHGKAVNYTGSGEKAQYHQAIPPHPGPSAEQQGPDGLNGSTLANTPGSFIGEKYHVKIRFDKDLLPVMEQIPSILEPEISESNDGKDYLATFNVSDNMYLCKQLFMYGVKVEILELQELRDLMIDMLKKSLSVYA